jgi:hypothetical protein
VHIAFKQVHTHRPAADVSSAIRAVVQHSEDAHNLMLDARHDLHTLQARHDTELAQLRRELELATSAARRSEGELARLKPVVGAPCSRRGAAQVQCAG